MKNAIKTCAMKALAAIALAFAALTAQAAYIAPGITINGTTPTKDGSYSGYTYQNGVFTLTTAGKTYELSGTDESGKVRVVVAANCTLELRSLNLDLHNVEHSWSDPFAGVPISLSGNVQVTVKTVSTSYLYAGKASPGLCVEYGQSVILQSVSENYLAVYAGFPGAPAIGGPKKGSCGNIIIEGVVKAFGGAQGTGIGSGAEGSGGSIVVKANANVYAEGRYPAPAIGAGFLSTGTMNIDILGGNVKAIQYSGYAAAIGTGYRAQGVCNISISGGSVQASVEAGDSGAGIGNGYDSTTETTIRISGGRVSAFGGGLSAGIGGGESSATPNIVISGGTVNAEGDADYAKTMDIGAGKDARTTGSTVVTGGSVKLLSGKGNLVTQDGTALNCITVKGLPANSSVDVSLTTSKGAYGGDAFYTSWDSTSGGALWLWVPPANYIDKLYVDGVRYDVDVSSGNADATKWQPPPPANDNFADAEVISGASGRVVGDNTAATMEGDLKDLNGYNADLGGSVWYSWTAPASGAVSFLVAHDEPPSYSMDVAVYSGNSRTSLLGHGSANQSTPDDMGYWGTYAFFNAEKGTTYKIHVAHGYYGCAGAFTLMWDYFTPGDWDVKINEDGTAKIGFKGGYYRSGAVTIPATIFGCAVKTVEKNGFLDATEITSVTIPEGVKTIGASAFNGCTSLARVDLPSTLRTIGEKAFNGCAALESISLPPGVGTIRAGAFARCSALKAVAVPNIVVLYDATFGYCDSLKTVTLPEGLTSIDTIAFIGCALESIVIPASVTRLGSGAFNDCSALKQVVYLGNLPQAASNIYKNTPADLVSYVPEGDDTWADALTAGTWRGCAIQSGLPEMVTMTFDANGGQVSPTSVTTVKGGDVGIPTPTRTGYEFDGWWTAKSGGGLVVPIGVLTVQLSGNLSCFAHWKPAGGQSYKVTFGKNGGTGGDNYVTATYGAAMPTPRTAPTLSGWTFAGYWDTLALDEKGNAKGKQYYDGSMKSVRAWDKTSATTLWAKWTNKVTFGKNGGTGGDSYVTCTKGQPMPKRKMPTKSGYAFSGYWTSTGAGGVKYYNADGTSARVWDKSGSVTLWAKWAAAAVNGKVTFGKNGGTGGDDYVTATYGKAMPTPRTAPKQSGWTFAGYWDTLAQDEQGNPKGKQYYDANMKSVRNWDKKGATTLWAKWTNKVTLGKNGGTGGDSYVTCTKGQPMPKRTMPTWSSYAFMGYWAMTSAGAVKYYDIDGTSAHVWDMPGSVTLWAKWAVPAACKVTLGKNGGTGGDSYVTATTGQPMPAPRTAPKRTGWTFAGYWDTLACDAKGNPKGKQYYDANMKSVRRWDKTTAGTLWAKWTVRVKLGKNGGTGGDDYVTVTYNQPFPKRAMPKKSGYRFGGYYVSASSKTGQCYNADGTGTSTMKWTTGGTPTVWALWTKTGSCVELPVAAARSVAIGAVSAEGTIPAGLYSGVLADGSGSFWLALDEPVEGFGRTAYLYVASVNGVLEAECTVEEPDGLLILTTEDGEIFAVDPAAASQLTAWAESDIL